jgi:hypothetical protein
MDELEYNKDGTLSDQSLVNIGKIHNSLAELPIGAQNIPDYVRNLKRQQMMTPNPDATPDISGQLQSAELNPPQISDYHPSIGRRIMSGIETIGGGQQLGQEVLNRPFQHQVQDYMARTGGMQSVVAQQQAAQAAQVEAGLKRSQTTAAAKKALADAARAKYYESETGHLLTPEQQMEKARIEFGYKPQSLDELKETEQITHPVRPVSAGGTAVYDPLTGKFNKNPYYQKPGIDESEWERRQSILQENKERLKKTSSGSKAEAKPKSRSFSDAWKEITSKHPEYAEFYKQDILGKGGSKFVQPTKGMFENDEKFAQRVKSYNQMVKDLKSIMTGVSEPRLAGEDDPNRITVEELNDENVEEGQ